MQLFTVPGKLLGVGKIGQNILVGNETSGAVELYSSDGRLIRSFLAPTSIVPRDLDVDPDFGRVFVTDGAEKNIKVFTIGGQFEQVIGGSGELSNPMGIAIDPLARLIVVSD